MAVDDAVVVSGWVSVVAGWRDSGSDSDCLGESGPGEFVSDDVASCTVT